jgi:hypothetical protein
MRQPTNNHNACPSQSRRTGIEVIGRTESRLRTTLPSTPNQPQPVGRRVPSQVSIGGFVPVHIGQIEHSKRRNGSFCFLAEAPEDADLASINLRNGWREDVCRLTALRNMLITVYRNVYIGYLTVALLMKGAIGIF